MRANPAFLRPAVGALLLASSSAAGAQVLYDGTLGTLPDQQGWTYGTLPLVGASAVRSLVSGAAVLDTTAVETELAGWSAKVPPLPPLPPTPPHPALPVLDRTVGYSVRFTLRLEEESHSSADRAGLSVIVLSEDSKGVEIGFWRDEVWIQSDSPLFTHAEGSALDTGAAAVSYELCVLDGSYRLSADAVPLLEGELRDYSAFGSPYDVPSYVFVGDDTSSAKALFAFAHFEIELEACGCRPDELDSDSDLTPDCADGCPEDPAKTEEGDCGCGLADRDGDGDGLADCEARPGDLHPDGVGDDLVGLPDFVLAHRKTVLGTLGLNAWDLLAGDLAPEERECLIPTDRLRACPMADGVLDRSDARLVRALAAGRLEISCEDCEDPQPGEGAALRRPGDVAPRSTGGNGELEVGDALLCLRWAVGLDGPLTAEELLRADLAPRVEQEGELVIAGDGELGVADVLLLLRAAVELETLLWPVWQVHADLTESGELAAFSLTVAGWPAWAMPAGFVAAHCPEDGIGGLDLAGDRWSLTCASEPDSIEAPARLGSLRHRGPEAIDPDSLTILGHGVDPGLEPLPITVELVAD